MQKFTLLVFSHNDLDKALGLVEEMRDVADEIVLMDSSERKYKRQLRDAKRRYGKKLRVFDTIALGYTEPIRNYAHKKCTHDWVLRLDADERITYPFKKKIHGIIATARYSAFAVRVYDVDVDREKANAYFGWQIQLYRKDAVTFRGMLHEQPQVKGALGKVNDYDAYIEHLEEPKKASGAFREYPQLEKIQRMSYRIYNRTLIDLASKFLMPESRSLEGSFAGKCMRCVLHAYEAITFRKQEEEISPFDYSFFFFAREFARVFREPRTIVDVIPYTRMFSRMMRMSRDAQDGREMFEISKIISDVGITNFLDLNSKKTVEGLAKRYAGRPQGPELLLKLLKERYAALQKREKYANMIISPHIDDAFFSLGGLLLRDKGKRQKVVNVFSVSNFTIRGRDGTESVTRMRKAEEMRNAKSVKAEVDFLPYTDAASESKYRKQEALIRSRVERYLEEGGRVFFPLGHGRHGDHILLARLGLEFARSGKWHNIYFYEDLPYAIRSTFIFGNQKPFIKGGVMEPECIGYSQAEKLRLCKTYESQTDWRIISSIMTYGLLLGHFLGHKEKIWKIVSI